MSINPAAQLSILGLQHSSAVRSLQLQTLLRRRNRCDILWCTDVASSGSPRIESLVSSQQKTYERTAIVLYTVRHSVVACLCSCTTSKICIRYSLAKVQHLASNNFNLMKLRNVLS